MLKKIQERIFPFIISLSALSVSASAAFYSVSGLSKLFAGAAFAVILMASSLEVAKLVIASLLYQYRETIPKLLKYYLTVAAVVLVMITSMGIYGFLSAAYQETANKAGNIDAQIALVEVKRDNVREQLAVYNAEKSTINGAVSDLRSGLSNNTIQYKDKETGQIITTTSSSTRRALEKQLDQAIDRQTEINAKVDELNEQLFAYETEIVEIQTGNDLAGELGPLKYLSGLTGLPMDTIINYLLLTIIFVFDPLAIALVIAANYSFEQLRKKYRENIYGEKVIVENKQDIEVQNEEEIKDLSTSFNVGDYLPEEWDEERIDIIGQNGNDGLHYYEEEEEKETPPVQEVTIEELEQRLANIPKTKKFGPFGRKAIEAKIKELKNLNKVNQKKNDKDNDLVIKY